MNSGIVFRSVTEIPEPVRVARRTRILRHPIWGVLGLRPLIAQHTRREHEALLRWAAGRARVAEIGVAEGVSALALRQGMDPRGILILIDPYHVGRPLGRYLSMKLAAKAVNRSGKGEVRWLRSFSSQAAKQWSMSLDLLFLDGDHSYEGVRADWDAFSPFIVPGGRVLFHDARVFPGGWLTPEDGPVRLVGEILQTTAIWQAIDAVDSLVVIERVAPDDND